jgi:protein SCO1
MAVRFGRVSRRVSMAIVVAIVLLAAAAALVWRSVQTTPAQQPHFVEVVNNAYILPKPDALASFKLVKHDDTPFDNDSLKGRWSFLIFGYTYCPDFCPTALVVFTEIHGLLTQRPEGARDVQFVMVSVDPERDTTALLKEYVPQFNREFIGVTGAPAEIARLAESVGAVYAKVPGSSERNYLIDHSTAVLLVNPQGKLQGVFAAPHVAKNMVQGFLKIREQAGAAVARAGMTGEAPLRVSAR